MTEYPGLFAALAAPFEPNELKTFEKPTKTGKVILTYVTARTMMNRLDDVLGNENWWDQYIPQPHCVICGITIRLPDGSTITKWDAGGYAGMSDEGDDDKSGFSDAFKRACVKHGPGRYLYRDGVPKFVAERAFGEAPAPKAEPSAPKTGASKPQVPKTGRELLDWVKAMGTKYELNLLTIVNKWARFHEFPSRMIDWNADQVAQGYSHAIEVLKTSKTVQAKRAAS